MSAGRPKVLFVLPNFAGGGAERVALTLLAGLDRDRFLPQLVVFDATGPLRSLLAEDVDLQRLDRPKLRHALPKLLGHIRRSRPAVVFASQGYLNLALLASRALMPRGTRLALRESNTPSQSLPNRRHPRLMTWGYRRFYRHADVVFCQHRQTEQELQQDFGVAAGRIVSLPNPVPVARLRDAAATPSRRPGGGPRFVAAGRLHRQKGFDRLIRVFAHMPGDAELSIYGEGGEQAALTALIRELGLEARVDLAGYSTNLPAALAGADACLIPSRWEGLPNVALEALACGTAVIATPESGGIAELAEAAPPGAVALASLTDDAGAPFLQAMLRIAARPVETLTPSLLPPRYELEAVLAQWNAALLHLTAAPAVVDGPAGPLKRRS